MALNIADARRDLKKLSEKAVGYDEMKIKRLEQFIDDVEKLIKNNSVKQTPALFRPFGEKP